MALTLIQPVDLSAYWKSDGTSTATGDWNLNNNLTSLGTVKAASLITTGGTSSQYVKGDGSLDSNAPPAFAANSDNSYKMVTSGRQVYLIDTTGQILQGIFYETRGVLDGEAMGCMGYTYTT